MDGIIKQLEFNNYTYQNIIANGNFTRNLFKGNISINDPNVKINGLVGTIDLSKKTQMFKFEADVVKLNLKNIHLVNDDISLNGKFNLNFFRE